MASNTLPGSRFHAPDDLPYLDVERAPIGRQLARLLAPLASLRLTVVLLAMAIFLVFAGTLAQTEKDIWEVMNQYFRTPLARIDFSIFFPKAFFPEGKPAWISGFFHSLPAWLQFRSFYYPGGFSLGAAMAVNLLAAHGLRFKIQTRGTRLAAGLLTIAAGVALTWLVVVLGPDKDGFEGSSTADWTSLWTAFRLGLAGLCLLAAYAFWTLDRSRKLERVGLGVLGLGLAALLVTLLVLGDQATPAGASMRILWQLMKGGTAGLVLLAGCILVFRKRAGIVLLHAGIGLMMANELVVYGLHSEGQMEIAEGQTVNYTQDIRAIELAVVDPSDAKYDDVVAIPMSKLADQEAFRDDDLHFDVKLVKYLKNARLLERDAASRESKSDNPATAGAGLQWIATEARRSVGTDTDSAVDNATAYVQFLRKGSDESLGTFLVSLNLNPQKVEVDGKSYDVSLRFKRNYKPYSVYLYDVKADKHPGTTEARSYASTIRLVDEPHDVARKVRIWMNNPLRYSGETFYQSRYLELAGEKITTLQVVTNAGWMIPYVGCMIVAIGMFAQFSLTLLRFLNRRTEEEERARASRARDFGGSRRALIWAPLVTVCLAVAWLSCDALGLGARKEPMDLYQFGKFPVSSAGRIKPFDTLARNSLCIISDKETFQVPVGDKSKDGSAEETFETQPAIRWLLDVVARPKEAIKHKVFRIQDLDVLQTLGLRPRNGWRYAIEEFGPRIGEFDKQVDQARDVRKLDPGKLTGYQRKLLELNEKINTFMLISTAFDARQILKNGVREMEESFAELKAPLAVPSLADPTGAAAEKKPWSAYGIALIEAFVGDHEQGKPINPATLSMTKILSAYAQGNAESFNSEVAKYRALVDKELPQGYEPSKTNFEAYFNYVNPFVHALVLYIGAGLLAGLGLLGWSRPFNRAAFWLIACAFLVHTFALVSRVYISGRPPVTNLYSSAVFIGWGCVVLGLVLEAVYRLGIGNLIAAITGFATLLIAYFLAADGDTFHVLEAVLDTQFWLATHVTCVTLGYATTFFAGMLGVLYILLGVLTPSLTAETSKALARMIYGVLCFAIFFSFVGTVLGGLWADDSWGRFWGWDPKENGALIIVLWNALVLHARWGGMVKDKGLATLACVGNIVVGWSWFGVNALGVGLHSYGFKEGVMLILGTVIAAQLAIIALGCVPKHAWWSFRTPDA